VVRGGRLLRGNLHHQAKWKSPTGAFRTLSLSLSRAGPFSEKLRGGGQPRWICPTSAGLYSPFERGVPAANQEIYGVGEGKTRSGDDSDASSAGNHQSINQSIHC